MPTTHLKIAKLDDPREAGHLEKALEAVPEVNSARIDTESHQAVVDHDRAKPEELTAAVKKLGYIAVVD